MTIRIGTDCSGIEAPIQALMQLGIPFEHKWACEKDKFARQSIEANYKPENMYLDITTRDHSTLPDIDMYVCGFPCQPFSLMGNKMGTNDTRGNIMNHCIEVIKQKLPSIFILENVKNFKYIQKGEPFNYLLKELEDINEYNVYHDIYNTKDYGIPQNRERIYIIGIKISVQVDEYSKPKTIPMRPLDDFIVNKLVHTSPVKSQVLRQKLASNTLENTIITSFTFCSPPKAICPTLTTQSARYYLTKYRRFLTPFECLSLQGFPNTFLQVVSNHQMYRQAGNSMSVCVLSAIMEGIFRVTLYNYLEM